MELWFSWHSPKARRNAAKHGVTFDLAAEAFRDPHLIVAEDREVDGEMRYHAIGRAASGQFLLLVVFVDRSTETAEVIHIVSARKAQKYEQEAYSDQFA
jgi:hypothetical protein